MTSRGRRRAGLILYAGILLFAWGSGGPYPFLRALVSAGSPNDFTPDYVAAHAWLHGGPHGSAAAAVLDGEAGNVYGATLGAREVLLKAAYYVHPPTAFLTLMPLVPFGYQAAAAVWLLLSVALLGLLSHLLVTATGRSAGGGARLALFTLLLFWPQVLLNLELGQWSILLATTIAVGHAAWERGEHQRGAAWFATAVALKLSPIVLLPFVALRDRRATVALFVTLAAAAALSLAAGQLDAWRQVFAHSAPNVAAWQADHHNTLSLSGLMARLLIGGPVARPLAVAPTWARLLSLGGEASLAGIALWLTAGRKPGAPPDRLTDGCCFALWNIIMVVSNPLAWAHYAILLLLPMALILRAADADRPEAPAMRAMVAMVAVALITFTIPVAAIDRAVRPLPLTPADSLLISCPLLGALLLFVAAALGARAGRVPIEAAEI